MKPSITLSSSSSSQDELSPPQIPQSSNTEVPLQTPSQSSTAKPSHTPRQSYSLLSHSSLFSYK